MANQKIFFVQFLFVKSLFRFKNTFGESFVEDKLIYQK